MSGTAALVAFVAQQMKLPLMRIMYGSRMAHSTTAAGTITNVRSAAHVASHFELCLLPSAVLDGKIVHTDDYGRPQFYHLLRRRSTQHFVAFDLVWLNGKSLRQEPPIERNPAAGCAAWFAVAILR
jgi:hypothetical protein